MDFEKDFEEFVDGLSESSAKVMLKNLGQTHPDWLKETLFLHGNLTDESLVEIITHELLHGLPDLAYESLSPDDFGIEIDDPYFGANWRDTDLLKYTKQLQFFVELLLKTDREAVCLEVLKHLAQKAAKLPSAHCRKKVQAMILEGLLHMAEAKSSCRDRVSGLFLNESRYLPALEKLVLMPEFRLVFSHPDDLKQIQMQIEQHWIQALKRIARRGESVRKIPKSLVMAKIIIAKSLGAPRNQIEEWIWAFLPQAAWLDAWVALNNESDISIRL